MTKTQGNSNRMKLNNPMFNKDIRDRVAKTLKEKYKHEVHPNKGRKRPDLTLSNLKNNPMKNKEAVEKVTSKNRGNHIWNNRTHPRGMLGKIHPRKGTPIHTEESKLKISKALTLEKNPSWLGGKSFELYPNEFNNQLKNLIRKRDNQICMNCGIHREKLNVSLIVHHINYNKNINLPQNLISLCAKCHGFTGINRIYWEDLFQKRLSKLYNYEYFNDNILIKFE